MSTYTQSWEERYRHMGDQAEGVFLDVAAKSGWQVVRFGLDRPPLNVGQLPNFIRFMPDYLMQHRLIECKGVGRDGILKIKVLQLGELGKWNAHMPVAFFIWNSYIEQYAFANMEQVSTASYNHGTIKTFPEGHDAYFIPLHGLEVSWYAKLT